MKKGIEKLPDGFTHSPVFLIRNLLRLLPAYYVAQTISRADDTSAYMPEDIFCRIMAASYVGKRDLNRRRLSRRTCKIFRSVTCAWSRRSVVHSTLS